jgi:hypothetical protein
VERFGFCVEIAPLPLLHPRENNRWLMLALEDH